MKSEWMKWEWAEMNNQKERNQNQAWNQMNGASILAALFWLIELKWNWIPLQFISFNSSAAKFDLAPWM